MTISCISVPAWALIHTGANMTAFVVASSRVVTVMGAAAGTGVNDLRLPQPPHTGFWLWEGISFHRSEEGKDELCELRALAPLTLLSYRGAACRINMHEK